MQQVRELHLYGNFNISRLKAAKVTLGFSDLLKPVQVDGSTSFARFLAWGDKPSGLGDYAYVTDETSSDGLVAALRWVLTDEYSPYATTTLSSLTNIFGFGVRELDNIDLNEENRKKAMSRVSFNLKLQEEGDSYDR